MSRQLGLALCCDATLVSPLTRTGLPQPCAAENDGAALRVAEKRKRAAYPELARGGPQRPVVLGAEVGGRWNGGALRFVRDLIRLRACRVPEASAAPRRLGKFLSFTMQFWIYDSFMILYEEVRYV